MLFVICSLPFVVRLNGRMCGPRISELRNSQVSPVVQLTARLAGSFLWAGYGSFHLPPMRIRTIKPEFFTHEGLFEAEQRIHLPVRIAFAGLWCCADREGRFKWEPRRLKIAILPYDECNLEVVMDELAACGFLIKYEINGAVFGAITNFSKHQAVNQREAQSIIPAPDGPDAHVHARARTCFDIQATQAVNLPHAIRETVLSRDGHKCIRCLGSDDLTIDHIFPQCIGGTNAVTNLRTLCRKCNSKRPTSGQALIDDLASDGFSMTDMVSTCMHVHARGEGKGREGKGRGKEGVPPEVPVKHATPHASQVELLPDERHHDITSKWGLMYRSAFEQTYSFAPRDAATLKRFLTSNRDASTEILETAAQAWHRSKTDRYAKRVREAATIHGLCTFYNDIRLELKTPAPLALANGTNPHQRAAPTAEDHRRDGFEV